MKFRLSWHAEEEMARRQIAREWLESVLDNPQQRFPQPGGMEIFQSLLESKDGMEKEPPVVVTVYRTSKIEKYWRAE